MCGIFGILQFDARPVDHAWLEPMGRLLRHRGPDDQDVYLSPDRSVGLGHRRLSIIDLTPQGRQPMWNEDGTLALIFNGEVYNFPRLREELQQRGHRFRSRTDSEVILHGYEEYGDAVVERLEAMFAFALWDAPRRRLLLARDRLGKKPLFYWAGPRAFVFASELKCLWSHPDVPKVPDTQAVYDYLTFGYVPSPRTMFRDVGKLPPGSTLTVDARGHIAVREFWDPRPGGDGTRPYSEYISGVRTLVKAAVEKRLISDVPVGAFLSGGVDSAIVVGLMRERMGQSLQTFTVGFEAGPRTAKVNEDLHIARITAGHFRTEHHEIIIDRRVDFPAQLTELVWHLDEPNANPTVLAMYQVAALARSCGVKVVLTGDGGDELFAGYPRYVFDRYVELAQAIPPWVREVALAPLRYLPQARPVSRLQRFLTKTRSIDGLSPAGRYLAWRQYFTASEIGAILAPDLVASRNGYDPHVPVARFMDRHDGCTLQERLNYTDLRLWIPDESNTRVDRMTMAVSLESRAPLLDHQLVEYAMAIPLALRLRGAQTKFLLRQAFADLLPRAVLEGRKKGFSSPVRWWLSTYLPSFVESVLSEERIRRVGLLNPSGVKALRAYASGWKRPPVKLWAVLMLQLWGEAFLS